MSRNSNKPFDCVAQMREARDAISAEIEHMSHDELVAWLRSHQYSDPVLKRLSEQVLQDSRPAPGNR